MSPQGPHCVAWLTLRQATNERLRIAEAQAAGKNHLTQTEEAVRAVVQAHALGRGIDVGLDHVKDLPVGRARDDVGLNLLAPLLMTFKSAKLLPRSA